MIDVHVACVIVRQVDIEQLMIVHEVKRLKTMKDEIISRDISYISHSIQE